MAKLAVLLCVVSSACMGMELPHNPPEPKPEVARILAAASALNMTVMQLAELAQQRSASSSVRGFALKELDERPRSEVRLERLAAERNVHLPTTIYDLDPQLADKLSRLTGREFDELYIDSTLAQFKQASATFEDYLKSGDDAGVRGYITDALPNFREKIKWAESQAVSK